LPHSIVFLHSNPLLQQKYLLNIWLLLVPVEVEQLAAVAVQVAIAHQRLRFLLALM
jgi:hypothetical protein